MLLHKKLLLMTFGTTFVYLSLFLRMILTAHVHNLFLVKKDCSFASCRIERPAAAYRFIIP